MHGQNHIKIACLVLGSLNQSYFLMFFYRPAYVWPCAWSLFVCTGCEVLRIMLLKIQVFCVVTPVDPYLFTVRHMVTSQKIKTV